MIQRRQGIAGYAGNQRSLANAPDFRKILGYFCESRPRPSRASDDRLLERNISQTGENVKKRFVKISKVKIN
jgi:hypothetical protein